MEIKRDFEKNEMLKFITGKEFRDSGMLWLVNTFLHTFGMAIALDLDTDELKATIVKYRGFSEENNEKNYKRVTQYMIDNSKELLQDLLEDIELNPEIVLFQK